MRAFKANMAARTRHTLQKPERYIDKAAISEERKDSRKHKKVKKDNGLYEIEVKEVNKEKKMVMIHYKGYDSRFDKWRPYGSESADEEYFPFIPQEKPHEMTDLSVEDRANAFIDLLYRAIKRSLYSGRKDDPDVRVEVDVADDVFNIILANITMSVLERGKRNISDINKSCLRWHFRAQMG